MQDTWSIAREDKKYTTCFCEEWMEGTMKDSNICKEGTITKKKT